MAKQERIPGTEGKSIPEVDVAGEEYRKARDARIKKTVPEKEKKAELIAVMLKHGLSVYRDDDAVPPFVVTVATKHNVKVTNLESGEEEGEEEELLS